MKKHPMILVTLLALWLLPLPRAFAATLTVDLTTDTTDTKPGDGQCADANGKCSLRAAIQEANKLAGDDQINLPAGTYPLTNSAPGVNEHAAATGDLDIDDLDGNTAGGESKLTLVGVGAATTIINGNDKDRLFHILPGAVAEIQGVTITNGFVSEASKRGGGIRNQGTLTLTNCVVSNNGLDGNDAIQTSLTGGGIYNSGTLVLVNSTIKGNGAETGGGIKQEGASASFIGTNSTISGNTANSNGGGIDYTSGTINLYNSTLFGNTANTQGGGVNAGATTQVKLKNTVIAGNNSPTGKDCNGQLTSEGFNWIQVQTGCNVSNVPSGDPKINATLADNGGPTPTHALSSNSPLLDAGDPNGCKDKDGVLLATDQRGLTRPLRALVASAQAICDIGAFELNPCSNGTKDSDLGEECDDSNLTSGDGCSSTCLDEDKDDDGSPGSNGQTTDCNDNNAAVKPGASESCNGTDDDCDGSTDEDFTNKGVACTVGTGACAGTGTMVCKSDGTTTVCSTEASNPGTETCNGIDDDCDGSTDEELGQTACGQGLCQVTVDNCKNGQAQTCAADESRKTTEVCGDNIDQDCDGSDLTCPPAVDTGTTTSGTNTGTGTDTGTTTGTGTSGGTTTTDEATTSTDSGGCSLIR